MIEDRYWHPNGFSGRLRKWKNAHDRFGWLPEAAPDASFAALATFMTSEHGNSSDRLAEALLQADVMSVLVTPEASELRDLDPSIAPSAFRCMLDVIETVGMRLGARGYAASNLQLTRLMLAVFGCMPSFGEETMQGMRRFGLGIEEFNASSLSLLLDWAVDLSDPLRRIHDHFERQGIYLPPMMLIDQLLSEIAHEPALEIYRPYGKRRVAAVAGAGQGLVASAAC